MKTIFAFFVVAVACCTAWAQVPNTSGTADDISGMYTFLQDGEFVQINVEEGLRVTGFISRYGESDADKGAFLDHLFTDGSLKGNHIEFKTRVVHGVSYEFSGRVERGPAKSTADEGYRIIRGKLTEYTEDGNKKTSARSREVTLKSFAQDAMSEKSQKD